MVEARKISPRQIAFEGLDGAGKSTHIGRLAGELEDMGLRVVVATSPGRNLVGGLLRRGGIGHADADRKNRLFTYDIRRTERQIPHTADVVIWDRHLDSVVVSNKEDAEEEVKGLAQDMRLPDTTIFLDIPVETSWAREGQNTDHPINQQWIQDKYRRYQALLAKDPDKFQVIDASLNQETVYHHVRDLVLGELAPVIEQNKKTYDLLLGTSGVVRFLLDEPFEVKPGVYLPMFINLKDTWSKPPIRKEVTQALSEKIGDEYDWVCGLESGGSYYAVTVANELGKPVSLYRKGAKEYGDRNFMVGEIPPAGSRVALLDDVYATGQSASRAVEQLKAVDCESTLFTVFSYSNDAEMKERLDANATSLTYFKGLRRLAIERGLLTDGQAAAITRQADIYRNTRF